MRGVIVEAGNCIYCGRHIDSNDDLFLCKNCRENEKEEKCQHGKLKAEEDDDEGD